MLYKNIFINGKNVLASGIFFTAVDWTTLAVTDTSRDITGMHARIVSPTYARVRTITLEGLIDRRISDLDSVEHLQKMFQLQRHIEAVDTREIVVEDEYSRKWKMLVKVKEPLDIRNQDDNFRGEYYKWRVVLESVGSPVFTSKDKIRVPAVGFGSEGKYGGMKLGTKLAVAWNFVIASLDIHAGASETPLEIHLSVKDGWNGIQAPITLKNVSTGAVFRLNTDLHAGETIVIDSATLKVIKNGADITTLRLPGSPFPRAFGRTKIVVEDADGRFISDDITIFAYFSNTLM